MNKEKIKVKWNLKNILKCAKRFLPFIMLAPIAMMVEVLLEVYMPQVMAQIIDVAIPSASLDAVVNLGVKMIIIAICSLLAGGLGCLLSGIGAMGFGSELRKAAFDKIQDFSFENIDSFQQSSLLTRLTTDVDYVQSGLKMFLTMFIRAPFMMIAAGIVAFNMNKDLFVVFVVAIPTLIVAVVILASIAMPKFKHMLTKYDGLNDTAKEYLTNVRVVKAYVREDYEKKKFFDINKELKDSSIGVEGLFVLLGPIMQIIIYSCILAVCYLGGFEIVEGAMEIGSLTAFISYIAAILSGLLMVAFIYINIIRLKGSFDRLNEVLNLEVTLVDGDYDGEVANSSIDFHNVSFRYGLANKDSVRNVDLHINAGETIGIIGPTGSGKTSLVQLIPRLYDVSEGELLVGNVDVKKYKIETLRDSVSMVLQQNVLFSGTIMDNLKWGNEQASEQDVVQACKIAQAHDFIVAFPDGYQTELGQGGVNVSGGQKQRLCIARALLKNPKIIILDDSTSAVDTHTDSLIRQGLKEKLKGTTTIIIAQRISSVQDADKVVVINNGAVEAFDTPANLLNENEVYRDIYLTQMEGVTTNG